MLTLAKRLKLKAASMQLCGERLCNEERGAALAEYALLVALIAVVCVVGVTALGTHVSGAYSAIIAALPAGA